MLKINNLIKVRAIWWIVTKLISALNFLVLATELKLLIFKISARTFLKNLGFRKELKLFATSYKYMYNNNLRTKRNSEPWFFDSFSSRKKNGKMKILAEFGIFIRIIILNIGSKKANTQLYNCTLKHFHYFWGNKSNALQSDHRTTLCTLFSYR